MGQQQSQQPEANPNNPQAAWWCKLLARGVGAVGGVIAFIMGIWRCVTVSAICIGAGVIQIFLAFIVIVMETPCCCQWLDIAKPIADFSERRPFFHKAILYCVLAIFPIAMCFSLSTLFGSGLIFAAGVLYGLMALGKKADREEMSRNVAGAPPPDDGYKTNLVDNDATGGVP